MMRRCLVHVAALCLGNIAWRATTSASGAARARNPASSVTISSALLLGERSPAPARNTGTRDGPPARARLRSGTCPTPANGGEGHGKRACHAMPCRARARARAASVAAASGARAAVWPRTWGRTMVTRSRPAATAHARDLGRERDGRRRGLVLGVGVGGGRRRVCSAVAEHGCEWRLLMREAQRLTHL